ncbi:ADP-heptose--LPS heptosyltransferase 2 [Candidatus Arsenophonus lipoptenae]|uniref:lipopolysaccharide heptosyltransferase II n=1 Tax=Candidatus Arsenophonus lipoptenae TaxID=634113 RepID=A0A109Q7B5_9GAMM|nr:lipopolysaccharide heptosyltransferase II [Candidatus Arsenophonus lipoptenae]AMA64723.1 ADP-heptose--LPS heptosyltransferase 2 [Candidatus Arsenophonus lipoptenae]
MKILIIGPSWIGDMMMSQSLYRTLKFKYPKSEIDVVAPDWCRSLLHKMPEINQAISMPWGHKCLSINMRRQFGIKLRSRHYDQAYVLPNSFKSALVPFFAGISKRIGWIGEMRYGLLNDIRLLNKSAFPKMFQRYVVLAYKKNLINNADEIPKPILLPKLSVTKTELIQSKQIFHIPENLFIIGFCPGSAFGPAKCWPFYHYAKLAKLLFSIYNRCRILIFGSKKDDVIAKNIRELLSNDYKQYCVNLTGKTTLEQVINLLASCQVIVTNDSGLMHIASALNIPLVVLYGPSSPDFTPSLSKKVKMIRLINGYYKIRKGNMDNGYHKSLIDIKPEYVITVLIQLLTEISKNESINC